MAKCACDGTCEFKQTMPLLSSADARIKVFVVAIKTQPFYRFNKCSVSLRSRTVGLSLGLQFTEGGAIHYHELYFVQRMCRLPI